MTRILFTGYAPVHFLCFQPLYEQLREIDGYEVHLSGGLRTKNGEDWDYDEAGLYSPFDVAPNSVRLVSEIADSEYDVLFAANTKMIQPRNVEKKIQIFHGISFRNKAVREENASADHYFLVGPYMRRKFEERGMFAADDPRTLSIGFPKTDRLINGKLNRAGLLNRYGFSGDLPVVVYAPTGQKKNSLEIMGLDVIRRISESGAFDLLIKLHDHPKGHKDWMSRVGELETEHTRLVRDFDVIPLMHAADLLITDASSVANEFALVDRPIVFLDVPDLIEAARSEGSAVDLDTWGRKGGVIVPNAEGVVEAISQSLERPKEFSEVRRASVRDLFYNPGRATEAALEWVTEQFPPRRMPTALEVPSR
jgi:CDP-glycerol glycerophosphotransferase (TagB/SpsB family)